jgi:hypothetical protein
MVGILRADDDDIGEFFRCEQLLIVGETAKAWWIAAFLLEQVQAGRDRVCGSNNPELFGLLGCE